MHTAFKIKDYSLSFPSKICFENFNTEVHPGSRIAIIGRNGSGKSTLLQMIQNQVQNTISVGYIPQIIDDYPNLSGGQRFNSALSQALALNPDILLLDEPTNHLDLKNRRSLIKMLDTFYGTIILVSHDTSLLRQTMTTYWHIDNQKIYIFSGKYDDYIQDKEIKRLSIEDELSKLKLAKKTTHEALMHEQKRAQKSKASGIKARKCNKSPPMVLNAKASKAQEVSGKKKAAISKTQDILSEQLSALHLPNIIKPKFDLIPKTVSNNVILSISNGSACYGEKEVISGIYLTLLGNERLAIIGNNGSGKSTLMKAIIGDKTVIKTGDWYIPLSQDIGYLDQGYSNLKGDCTPFSIISTLLPYMQNTEIRKYLNEFLFRTNEEVNLPVSCLSGGEKVRLTLAIIAALPPKLLILDEITNNIDLETKYHIVSVLKEYKGAMIIISHEEDFIKDIGINRKLVLS